MATAAGMAVSKPVGWTGAFWALVYLGTSLWPETGTEMGWPRLASSVEATGFWTSMATAAGMAVSKPVGWTGAFWALVYLGTSLWPVTGQELGWPRLASSVWATG